MERLEGAAERPQYFYKGVALRLTRTARFALSKSPASEILFGRSPARALMSLALGGPTCFRRIGELFPFELSNIRRACARLSRIGIVVFGPPAQNGSNKYVADDGNIPEAWRQAGVLARDQQVALDPRFPMARELRALLVRFASAEGLGTRAKASLRPAPTIGTAYIPEVDGLDRLFSTPERTQVMLSIAALGSACPGRLAFELGLEPNGVYLMMSDLACVGVLASRRKGVRRIFSIDTSQPWSTEMKELLRAMLRARPDYAALPMIVERCDRASERRKTFNGTVANC